MPLDCVSLRTGHECQGKPWSPAPARSRWGCTLRLTPAALVSRPKKGLVWGKATAVGTQTPQSWTVCSEQVSVLVRARPTGLIPSCLVEEEGTSVLGNPKNDGASPGGAGFLLVAAPVGS